MTQRRTARSFLFGMFGLVGVFTLTAVLARGDTPISFDSVDVAKPIQIRAQTITHWVEGNSQVMLLRGGVTVQQGLLRAKMRQAVAWLTAADAEKGKPLSIVVYGEGDVEVERPGEQKPELPPKVLLQLRSRAELRLQKDELISKSASDDVFYRHAVDERQAMTQAVKSSEPRNEEILQVSGPAPLLPSTTLIGRAPRGAAPSATPTQRRGVAPAPPLQTTDVTPPGTKPRPGKPQDRPKRVQVVFPGSSDGRATSFLSGNERVIVVMGGVSIYIDDLDGGGVVDLSTDRAVIWVRDTDDQKLFSGLQTGKVTGEKDKIEIYLEGHVQIRQADTRGKEKEMTRLIMADQAYYDVSRHTALLLNGEVVAAQSELPAQIHFRASEIRQVAENRFEADQGIFFASRLSSDPDFTYLSQNATLEERKEPVRGVFGGQVLDANGQPKMETKLWATGSNNTLNFWNQPVGYFPHVEGDPQDPLGPLDQVRFRQSRTWGTGVMADWDMFQLLGGKRPSLTKWTLQTDYLSARGPALGTDFETAGQDLFGIPGKFQTLVKGYIIDDTGTDRLSTNRIITPPRELRGRFELRHRQELEDDFTFMGQLYYLSDRNFLEQYYKREFDEDENAETYVYLKQQRDFWAWSVLAQPNLRQWVTETEWLPKLDGHIIGLDVFDNFTYFARGSAGYARQRSTADVSDAYYAKVDPTDFFRYHPLPPSSDWPSYAGIDTGRFDLFQELDLPLQLGPLKLVPYGLLDLTYYTESLTGDPAGRVYGGGGARASMPFTAVYPDVCSQLWNLNGIAHKISLDAEYRWVQSNQNFRELPLLDRLDDDATDQARRDLRAFNLMPFGPLPTDLQVTGRSLATLAIYDPQLYALRRGLMTNVDNLDDLQFLTFGIHQRLQTKRGFPGAQHIIDWMTLDMSATYFPESDRDNFGKSFGYLQYDYTWHIGDRTTFLSSGWLDPFENGGRVVNVGFFLERPERIRYYFGYRQIDPVGSQAFIGSMTYLFSPKYAVTLASTYDFGTSQNLGNTFILTRIGSDVQVSFGLTYNPLQGDFGLTFEVVPALGGESRVGKGMLANAAGSGMGGASGVGR